MTPFDPKQFLQDKALPGIIHLQEGRLKEAAEVLAAAATEAERLEPNGTTAIFCWQQLAEVRYSQQMIEEAEPLVLRVLAYFDQRGVKAHPMRAEALVTLGKIQTAYKDNPASAESLFREALSIVESFYGSQSQAAVMLLTRLGSAYRAQGMYQQAMELFTRALSICTSQTTISPLVRADVLQKLAGVHRHFGHRREAVQFLRTAVVDVESVKGRDFYGLGYPLSNLGEIYATGGPKSRRKAAACFRRVLAIFTPVYGRQHPDLLNAIDGLANIALKNGDFKRAARLFRRSLRIVKSAYGTQHRAWGRSLCDLAHLFWMSNRFAKAERCLRQALACYEVTLKPDHPEVAKVACELASLLIDRQRYTEAEPLLQRALAIQEEAIGVDHPQVLVTLEAYVVLFQATHRHREAEAAIARAEAIQSRMQAES